MSTTLNPVCPEELRIAFLDLLTATLITIRNDSTDSRCCAAFADHMHNVPTLLMHFRAELLAYYWDVERPCFLRALRAIDHGVTSQFKQPWQVIEREYHRLCR